jgi:hypothetical protein
LRASNFSGGTFFPLDDGVALDAVVDDDAVLIKRYLLFKLIN